MFRDWQCGRLCIVYSGEEGDAAARGGRVATAHRIGSMMTYSWCLESMQGGGNGKGNNSTGDDGRSHGSGEEINGRRMQNADLRLQNPTTTYILWYCMLP